MASTTTKRSAAPTAWQPPRVPVVAILAEVTADGVPSIDYPGNPLGPLPAKVLAGGARLTPGLSVVVIFEDDDAARPVILGPVSDRLPSAREVTVDGERLVLEARREIVLRCGRGSITLQANGKVVIKGTELVSRAAGANKIRGGVVQIN